LSVDDALYLFGPRAFASRVRAADVVLTGNREIAREVEKLGATVVTVDTAIAVDAYPERRATSSPPVTIGWVGTNPTEHLRPIVESLSRVCNGRDAKLRIVSSRPAEVQVPSIEFREWKYADRYRLFAELDIGIMPLEDTAYNRGKEAYKIKEYMAAALPVVASPVGHNVRVLEDGVTGYFATTDEEWVDRLCRLINDPELRRAMGAAGRQRARQEYAVDRFHSVIGDIVAQLVMQADGDGERDSVVAQDGTPDNGGGRWNT
jgi:glycosyltransferase involved in cell wall biosynthesis